MIQHGAVRSKVTIVCPDVAPVVSLVPEDHQAALFVSWEHPRGELAPDQCLQSLPYSGNGCT